MNKKIALLTALISTVAATHVSHASSWRCVDDPSLPDCEEALINDIEDTIQQSWPSQLTVPVRTLPYSCTRPSGGGQNGEIAITSQWSGAPRTFLLGRRNAVADITAQVQLVGTGVLANQWPATSINYFFEPAATDVPSPGGSTGVRDLGAVTHQYKDGAFWVGNVGLMLHWLPVGSWTCVVGPPGAQVTKTHSGAGKVTIQYPIAWTLSDSFFAEAVREQFRRAVRQVVTGTP